MKIYFKSREHVVMTLSTPEEECVMDHFPKTVPAVKFNDRNPSITGYIESHNAT